MSSHGSIILVGPTPPPFHGAAFLTASLLENPLLAGRLRHVNTRFASELDDLSRFRIRKLWLLSKFLWQLFCQARQASAVILLPSFQPKTFCKDSLFIWLCWLLRCKAIIGWYHMRFETMDFERRSWLFRWFVRLTLTRVDWHVCVSPRLKSGLPAFLNQDRLCAVTNGFDVSKNIAANTDRSDVVTRILFLSHMGEAKGWRLLLGVAKMICDDCPNVEIVFHGAPAYETTRTDIEFAFSKAEIGDRKIHYGGFANEEMKEQLFATCDLLCFPSYNEAFPVTIVEAMAAGLPVVASNVGGIADAIDDGEGGFLFEPGDHVGLERGLRRLVEDEQLRVAFGEYNKIKHQREFTEQAFWTRWAACLDEKVLVNSTKH